MTAPLSVRIFTGAHSDLRIEGLPAVYGLGSYVPHPLPPTLEYVYITLTNIGTMPVRPDAVFLQTENDVELRELDLPAEALYGRELQPGSALVVGFLRDLLTRRLRDGLHQPDPFRCRACCSVPGRPLSCSQTMEFSLDYPHNPLQDAELSPYVDILLRRRDRFTAETARLRAEHGSLRDYADLHLTLGMHKIMDENGLPCWRLREWMPAATSLWLTTDRLKFQRWARYAFRRVSADGLWELVVPAEELPHGAYMELRVLPDAEGSPDGRPQRRVPAFARWVEQDAEVLEQWCARVWDPPEPYVFRHDDRPRSLEFPRIYEAHVGIAQPYLGRTERSVGSYAAFARHILPRIRDGGYTAVQLMAVAEHPLYKSFGYQVSSYFAPSSRFGLPDDFKALVDEAHRLGLAVILDITHSHAAPNTEQGLARYDTGPYLFADKDNQWGTVSFDYGKEMTRRFLLSNCRYWMEEYHVDGFRFDAVGNMIYLDHGFGDDFSHVGRCFYTAAGSNRVDQDGVLYLELANTLVHELRPQSLTIAEEFSGMPGMTSPPSEGGLGFDHRFAMGIPDFWGKFIKEGRSVGMLWYEMTNRRRYERTISYVACHDQCINGKDAMIWRLIGDEMYTQMSCLRDSWNTSRGLALYKLMRLVTLATAAHGYLSFMGDEFGHPEWIDGEAYAHRQWHLAERDDLRYADLAAFDRDCLREIVGRHLEQFRTQVRLRHLDEDSRTLAFERDRLLFVFNFHELHSQPALELWVTPGKYVEMLSSDEPRYSGHGNMVLADPPVEHFSDPHSGSTEQRIGVYLPPLTALTLLRE